MLFKFKIVPKVKPLVVSFLFAFLAVLVGQILLSYENENLIIAHCRQSNLQTIFAYNNLDEIPPSDKPKVLGLLKPKKFCYEYLTSEIKDQLKILDQYPLKDYDVLYQVVGYKIRLYADSYNRIENQRSVNQSRFLIGLLILNVAALAAQAIFLKADSKDIDDEI